MAMSYIAGVALADTNGRPCRVYADTSRFAARFSVSQATAIDGTASAVAVEVTGAGARPLAVRVAHCPVACLRAIVAAVNDRLAAGQGVRVRLPGAVIPVDVICVPAGDEWFAYDDASRGDIIRDVRFRFTALADAG